MYLPVVPKWPGDVSSFWVDGEEDAAARGEKKGRSRHANIRVPIKVMKSNLGQPGRAAAR